MSAQHIQNIKDTKNRIGILFSELSPKIIVNRSDWPFCGYCHEAFII
jgi:hypothetical protein